MKNYSEVFNLSNLWNIKTGFISLFGSLVFTYLGKVYGGEVGVTIIGLLVLTIGLDWTGAIAASKKDGSYSSQYGINGVLRTCVMIALPAWGRLIDIFLNSHGFFFYLICAGLIYHTCISMTANFTRAGWDKWIPTWLLQMITSEIEAKIKRAQSRKGESK
jgi:toxin secretion/phage lysis holin